MNNDFFKQMNELERQSRIDRLQRDFPGESCGNPECENQCAEACQIAKKLNLAPVPFLEDFIRREIVPRYHCIKPDKTDSSARNVCRFGFQKPDSIRTFSDEGTETTYIFHAHAGGDGKCRELDGKSVTEEEWNDESFMKKLGFWKQKDGSYKPHPNCKCTWEERIMIHDYSRFSWEKTSSGKLAVYEVRDLPGRLKTIPPVLREKLAKQVALDANEFDQWAQNINYEVNKGKTTIYASVPNVWICADLLQGGIWYWDIPIVNWGGSIGQVVSYLGTWGMYEIKCKTVQEVKDAFNKNPKAVWGFVLYGHGSKSGYIGPRSGSYSKGTAMTQNELMGLVDAQGFKLGKLYLMQCDSGANGLFSIEITYSEIIVDLEKSYPPKIIEQVKKKPKINILTTNLPFVEKRYQDLAENTPHLEFKDCFIKDDSIIIVLYCAWGVAWGKRVVGGMPNISYQGINAIGLDWGFLEKNPLKK